MKLAPAKCFERSGLAADFRNRGYTTCFIPWGEAQPSDLFSRFDALLEETLEDGGVARYRRVDELLVKRAGDTPLQYTSPIANLSYNVHGLVGFGHSYFPGTLRAVRQLCSIPPRLETLWETLEMVIATAAPILRHTLSSLPGADGLRSGVRIWKNIRNDLPWVTPPHYDLTVVSAILATANPSGELLRIGLEANGAPIRMVRERIEHLRQHTPTSEQFAILLPGIFANRWIWSPLGIM